MLSGPFGASTRPRENGPSWTPWTWRRARTILDALATAESPRRAKDMDHDLMRARYDLQRAALVMPWAAPALLGAVRRIGGGEEERMIRPRALPPPPFDEK
jgi:hypothetical protein